MKKRIGKQTVKFEKPPVILSASSVVGPKEGEGPLRAYFDVINTDILNGADSWEKAESRYVTDALKLAVTKCGKNMKDIDYILAGDLLNQGIGTTFGVRELDRPLFGLFGACSTMGEALSLSAMLVDGGFAQNVLASASSHFCSAEKQFRFPLELGTQRPPSSTWTVTGDGAAVVSSDGAGPRITYATTGKIVDMGVKDANNMGAVMAPAAADVLAAHFRDTGRSPDYYDVIATGDLGYIGKELAVKLLDEEGIKLGSNYTDCGIEIFDKDKQDTHSGGSGCACSAVTFCGYFYNQLNRGNINSILFVPTGALMSTTSSQQGETIPGIAHAVAIENKK